ncbi:TIGR02281 family clan AA aspartic protease [Vampirovibrio sp.]|uniref:retropepsin-like aspartic protease family protein n=1 Tax=Vampirovibrio sp. TaxID=2717857 RepID=UPI0035941CF0
MNNRQSATAGFFLMVLTATLTAIQQQIPANAQDVNPQLSEATLFFNRLASESHNPLIANLARESLYKLKNNAPVRQVIVPLLEQADTSLVVPTLIEGKVMASFLVDTGSSYTVITPRLAQKLGVVISKDTPKVPLITANGPITAPLITLKNISIGQVNVPEVSVVVQELGNGDDMVLSGLLGMNFFQGMDITLKEDQLILGIRENPRTSMK